MTPTKAGNDATTETMTDERIVKVSKYLSKHLRHQPERIGLTLEEGGWVRVDDLLAACAANQMRISRAQLEEVVAQNDKKRFSFDETGTKIRANQGHSVEVDLMLEPVTPPDVLYHGTGHRSVDAIRAEGLKKMNRHHVHLSPDVETATRVGARHGRPVIFTIEAKAMYDAGFLFYRSENGVWLVDDVPASYLHAPE
jgi:putative RNA 2'-phosphotransferase